MKIIDVHTHYITPYFRKVMAEHNMLGVDLVPVPDWSLDKMIDALDVAETDMAIMAASPPDQHFGNREVARDLSREMNEFGAECVQKHPDRLRFVATLPLPEADDSLEEIRYCFDELHCDGVRLLSNNNGYYPGHPIMEEVFAELNRRKAVCILHPCRPAHLPENTLSSLTVPIYEFFPETSRAVINLILSGTLERYPDLKIIVPHNGALVIPMLERIQLHFDKARMSHPELQPVNVVADAQTLYFDVAGNPLPRQLDTMLTIIDEDHVLFGMDYPYVPGEVSKKIKDALLAREKTQYLNQKLFCDNALKLFPSISF